MLYKVILHVFRAIGVTALECLQCLQLPATRDAGHITGSTFWFHSLPSHCDWSRRDLIFHDPRGYQLAPIEPMEGGLPFSASDWSPVRLGPIDDC
jgi:hypothetical protein